MKIIAELQKHYLQIQIGDDRIEINVGSDFYKKIKGKEAYRMFFDKAVNTKIKNFVFKKRNALSFWEKIHYIFSRNEVDVTVGKSLAGVVQEDIIRAYLILALDARTVRFEKMY